MSGSGSVDSAHYDDQYYRESCGGSEFFSRYGAKVLKPQLAYSLKRAELAPGMRVLDVGCGRGEMLYHVRELGASGVGTDYAQAALKLAAEVSGCPVALCDAKALPFKDASFDRVFLLGVVDHLHDWELEAAFGELRRVLRPGGKVVIHTCCNKAYYKNLTFGVRRALAKALGLKEPSPPRSGEDEALHVNEHSGASLSAFFARIGWRAEVEPRPNYKLELAELYGERLPEGFPMTPAAPWKRRIHRALLWRRPLSAVLAREFFCLASPA